MIRIIAAVVLAALSFSAAAAGSLKWAKGFDRFGEQLDLDESFVTWSYYPATRMLKINYSLYGAEPTRLFQVGIHLYCIQSSQSIVAFGAFPTTNGKCLSATREGRTFLVDSAELGAVLTDGQGNGSFEVDVGPLAPGNYAIQFHVRNRAGCRVAGGSPPDVPRTCGVAFEAPGPFGTTIPLSVK